MNTQTALMASVMLISCASTATLFEVAPGSLDDPSSERIQIEYTNMSTRAVCLLPEFWPNDFGRMDHEEGSVFLTIRNQKFPLKSYNAGYCAAGCSRRVRTGESIKGYFSYSDFNVPRELYSEPKTLTYYPKGYPC